MVTLLRMVIVLSIAQLAHAETKIPDLRSWYKETISTLDGSLVPKRHLFIKKTRKGFKQVSYKGRGFVSSVPKQYFRFFEQKIGKFPQKKRKTFIKTAFSSLPIDVIVEVGKKRSRIYQLQTNEKLKSKKLEGRARKTSLSKWYRKQLGFDGVVLAAKGEFLLIQGLKKLKKDSQAVSLVGSENRLLVKDNNAKASSLIQLVKSKGAIGIFEVLLKDKKGTDIGPGTKVLFGSKGKSK